MCGSCGGSAYLVFFFWFLVGVFVVFMCFYLFVFGCFFVCICLVFVVWWGVFGLCYVLFYVDWLRGCVRAVVFGGVF